MAIKTKQVDDIAVLYPKGYFSGGEETDELFEALHAPIKSGTHKVVVNLRDTQHLVSVAIGTLIAAYTHYAKNRGKIVLCNVNDRINIILVIAKLVFVFDAYENEAEAIKALKEWVPETEEAARA